MRLRRKMNSRRMKDYIACGGVARRDDWTNN